MEVLVGPTLGIDVSSPPACVRDCTGGAVQDKHSVTRFSPLLKDLDRGNPEVEQRIVGEVVGQSFGIGLKRSGKSESQSSSESSSSIGEPDESEENGNVSGDGESEEVQSKFNGGLGSLGSLEESLPIKRGLSNYFIGKSKSFGNLAEVSKVKDLEKEENPLNKRRRTLMASKWARKKSSFYTWSNPTSMPLLTLSEDQEEEEDDDEEDGEEKQDEKAKAPLRKFKSFKSSSCFSLTALQEQHDDNA